MNKGISVLPKGFGIVYVITDTENNKLYVGQSKYPLKDRWKEHVRHSRGEHLYPLAESIKNKGVENFYVNIIEVVKTSMLCERETFWIDILRTHITQNGYNVTAGGIDGNKVLTDDSKIVEVYKEVKSIRETAKITGVSRDIVSNRIKKSGLEVYNMSEIRGKTLKVTRPDGDSSYFNSKIELAKWFVENSVGESKKISTIRKKISSNEKINYFGYLVEPQK